MKNVFGAALLVAAFQFTGAVPCAAAGPGVNLTIEKMFGFGAHYLVNGSEVNLDIQNNSFQNDPFARYSITGSMFGRQLGVNNAISNDNFGGAASVIIDADGVYAKFSKQPGWPELRVETRLAANADPRAVVLLSVLANYLPPIPGASSPGGSQPTQSYSFRQFGDSVLVEGAGLSNLRVERTQSGQGCRYTVRGSGFGRNFDSDRLELELDNVFLGAGGTSIRGAGMALEIKREDFGGPRLSVRGIAGDSGPLAAFSLALARHLNGANY
ncbi:MAG TPA: hypothetical protein DCS63_03385 [Elusimicrobia bacterium]|nr:hypothetical protein [Elusimicrobiota bacterium]